MQLSIREDDPASEEASNLIEAHLANSAVHSPPESIHALDISSLKAPNVTFWTAWAGPDLAGCSALKELDPHHGEIKSMHTALPFRGNGVGGRMVAHIIDQAVRRSYRRLSLETGTMEGFAPSRALYRRFGFEDCPPFAGYRDGPNSVCMTLDLTAGNTGDGMPIY